MLPPQASGIGIKSSSSDSSKHSSTTKFSFLKTLICCALGLIEAPQVPKATLPHIARTLIFDQLVSSEAQVGFPSSSKNLHIHFFNTKFHSRWIV